MQKINESIQSIPLLGNDPVFHPFTRPILYGKLVEVYRPALSGGSEGFLLSGHDDISRSLVEKIETCMSDAFQVCRAEMEIYKETAAEFCEVRVLHSVPLIVDTSFIHITGEWSLFHRGWWSRQRRNWRGRGRIEFGRR